MKILITGANSGIGQATAYKFAKNIPLLTKEGLGEVNLILTYNKNQTGAEKTKQKCLELGAKSVEIFELDLSSEKNILEFSEKIINQYKNIDILINNAGFLTTGKTEKMNFQNIEQSISVNLTGLIKLTAKLLPIINKTIINIGSTLSYKSKRNFSIYCASKHGVRGFTKSIAKEYPHLKIYLVNPGLIATAMTNFKGENPNKIAKIILNILTNKNKIKSGADINANDYKYGKNLKFFLIMLRFIKKNLKYLFKK